MKTLLVTVILAAALSSVAGQENFGLGQNQYNPESIYNALKVKERNLNPGIVGVGRFGKSVGGLACVREQVVVPGAKAIYTCDINQAKENFAAIYKALNVKEVALNPGIVGVSRFEKLVGGLSCIRELVVVPHAKPTFTCQITE